MSASEEEPCGTRGPMVSTPRRSTPPYRRRRSKLKDPSIELNDDDKEELLREFADTDQNLEKFAKAHNMTALNVKSVLRSLIKNHSALSRVLGTDAPDDCIDGVRITRSKTKALQDSSNQGVDMTSNVPIKRGNSWVDLRFNENDEYDNDYRPDEDESGDEMGTDSSVHGSSDDEESERLSELDKDEENYEQSLTIVDDNEDLPLNDIGLKSKEYPLQDRSDSAASLTLNAMMGEDEPSIEYKTFLDSLNMEEMPYDEDDEDPEFMVPTDDLFRDERDDEKDDFWSSIIRQKEIEDLIEDIVPSDRIGELARNLSPPLRQVETTRQGTAVEPRAATPTRIEMERERSEVVGRAEIFTDKHRSQLRTQLEQHVQLLTQSYVGCYFEVLLQEEKEKARQMIVDLNDTAKLTWHLGSKSAFHISNLAFSMETMDGMSDQKVDPYPRPLAKEHLTIPHSILPITKEILSSSRAIIYPQLVSRHRLVQSIGSSGWNQNETILFAMALNRHKSEPIHHRLPRQGKYGIIALNCLPWRTMDELRWQYNGIKRGLTRNGRTRHNREFFDVVEGKKMEWNRPLRAKLGWTMSKWHSKALPQWFDFKKMKRKSVEVIDIEKEDDGPEKKKGMRNERRIEEGDDEMEAIVIVDDGGEENEEEEEEMKNKEIEEEEKSTEMEEKEETEERRDKRNENSSASHRMMERIIVIDSPIDDDECAMDSMDKRALERSPEEIEEVRGEEGGKREGQPIDFSHLMNEMSPPGPSTLRTPSPTMLRSMTPDEKTILPSTPGKRFPSPLEESMPWLDMDILRRDFESPPRSQSPLSPLSNSRIKTPGGTRDYVDSLIGYFGTPEREEREEIEKVKERQGGTHTINRTNTYSNLFGDFDFDESDGDDDMTGVADNEIVVMKKEESVERAESVSSNVIDDKLDDKFVIPEVPVKQRNKRTSRVEKERRGLAAIKDSSFRHRVMNGLARKASEDIRSRMNMHSSIFKQIQHIFSLTIDKKDRETMFTKVLPVLSSNHKEVLYVVSAFAPPSSLPRSLVLSQARYSYVAAINIMCIIYAYMSKIQRKISYRQLLKMIVEAHSKGGNENVLSALKDVLVNDPLLMRVLSEYITPSSPSKKSSVWEVIDIRKGDEAFNIFSENAEIERVDLCEVMGGVATKKMILQQGKEMPLLMINHDGEPVLRNKDGKYKEITVMSEKQMEDEKAARAVEKEEEKKAKQREKMKERMKAVKKAKMVERREERAREKKKEKERILEEVERKKEEKDAPPSHPFNRDMDMALLMLYNQVQKVTKRAVRKMNVDIPYSTNFTLDQLQSRLDFLLSIAKEE